MIGRRGPRRLAISIGVWRIVVLFAWKTARFTWGHVESGYVSDFAYF